MRFLESQSLPRARAAAMLAIPPLGMLLLLIWQVVLGHPWGKQPMSNGSIEFWTVFLWLFYIRLLTIRLATQVNDGELIVRMKGLWRRRLIPIAKIRSAEVITFDPFRDYGGFGIRSTRSGKAYIAQGNQGVKITLDDGKVVVVGSQKSAELKAAIDGER